MGALGVGGAIAGVRAGNENAEAKDFQSGYKVGYQVGVAFRRRYGGTRFLGALGISGVVSIALALSGMLPWCRSVPRPPELPGGQPEP